MMATMNGSDATFRHRSDVDRDLDLHLRRDPDRSVSVGRSKRLRSASELTSSPASSSSSLAYTSHYDVQQTGALPRGLSNKLKVNVTRWLYCVE